MDSLTQIVLGAAVGEAVLGKKVGNKAPLWGAIAGTIPDLDVFLSPFVSEIQGLAVHRGFSHSITFSVLFAPLFGWLMYEYGDKYRNGILFVLRKIAYFLPLSFINQIIGQIIYKYDINNQLVKNATLRDWQWLFFWGLVTHPLLDCFTNWGTQLFQPFSSYRVAFNTISVVDPIYTVPFGICLLVVLFLNRENPWRTTWNKIGLVSSTLIMALTCVNKISAHTAFRNMLRKQGSSSTNISTYALPLNLLWYAVAEEELGYQVGLYSVVGKQEDIYYRYVPKNRQLVEKLKDDEALAQLNWFSKGQWTVETKNDTLYWYDLRFGLQNLDRKDTTTKFNFTYKLITNPEKTKILEIQQVRPPMKEMKAKIGELLKQLWKMSWGDMS